MISTTSETSIESYAEVRRTKSFEKTMQLLADILITLGPSTVDEVRHHIIGLYPSLKGKDEIGARMADTQRVHGLIRKTKTTRRSDHSGKKGYVWMVVDAAQRVDARKEYWAGRALKLEADYAKAKKKLEKEIAKIPV